MVRKFVLCSLSLLRAIPPSRGADAVSSYSFTYVPEEPHKYRVREVWSAREVSVARAAVGVGRVRQSCQRTFEVEEKDAVPLRVEARETRLHGPAPLR